MRKPFLLVLLLLFAVPVAWADIFAPGYREIQEEGTAVTKRRKINFVGSSMTCEDDSSNKATKCTSTAGTGTMTTLKEGGTGVGGADIATLDFGAGFDLTESPDTEVNVVLDYTEDPPDLSGSEVTGTLDVPNGGTGATTLTDGGPLLGSGTDAVTAMAVLADGEFIVGDGTTDPVAESGATARTSLGVAIGSDVQAWDAELDTIAALTETNGNVMFVAGGVWTSDATPAIDCTDCTNIPAGSATAWDDIADADAAATILLAGHDQDITSAEDGGDILTIGTTDADQASATTILRLFTNDTNDTSTTFLEATIDEDGTPVEEFHVKATGTSGGIEMELGNTGVLMTTDGDGQLTLLSQGGGNNEDLAINLDDIANEVTMSSSTGVDTIAFAAQDLQLDNGVLRLKEQADADGDQAGYGQIWVDTATPNKLFFTDDAGTDTELGAGGSDIAVRVRDASTQSLTDGTFTAINFDTEDFDTDTMHDNATNNTRITFTTAGKYTVGCGLTIEGGTVIQAIVIRIRHNGSTYIAQGGGNWTGTAAADAYPVAVTRYDFAATDYAECYGYVDTTDSSSQNSSASASFAPQFWANKEP